MIRIASLRIVTAIAALFWLSASAAAVDKAEKQRQEIRSVARSAIEHLYEVQPKAREALEGAAGYAVFSNFGLKLFIGGGGSGNGVAFDRTGQSVTYMKMAEIQAGLGFRIKKYQQIWVFENASDLERFISSGWEMGAQTTASAALNNRGGTLFTGAMSVRPGVWLYQFSGDGLALDVTAKGTKYYRNKKLN
jgi:lipid-binding SYLF domain-containing protein